MNTIKILFLVLSSIVFLECGNPGVNVNDAAYEPKITVEGYLYCGETIKDIRLTRNFTLGVPIDTTRLYLTPTGNNVVITINGTPLNFDPQTNTYYNNQINIDFGKTYMIEVSAVIDGKNLHTTSSTTTPLKGFRVINKNLGIHKYNSTPITVNFIQSPGTDFYAFSIVPDSASLSNFIYNNVFRTNLDSSEVIDHFNQYKFRDGEISNLNSYLNISYPFVLNLRDTWFYSSYTIIAYAGDSNFKNYFMTAPAVQEFDGNFHEPIQIFQGDGIGVFASAIRDTIKFTLVK